MSGTTGTTALTPCEAETQQKSFVNFFEDDIKFLNPQAGQFAAASLGVEVLGALVGGRFGAILFKAEGGAAAFASIVGDGYTAAAGAVQYTQAPGRLSGALLAADASIVGGLIGSGIAARSAGHPHQPCEGW